MFWEQNINTLIALAGVAAVGIGASYMIIRVAHSTDFSYISTDESILFTAEIQKGANADTTVE